MSTSIARYLLSTIMKKNERCTFFFAYPDFSTRTIKMVLETNELMRHHKKSQRELQIANGRTLILIFYHNAMHAQWKS
jgi:ornithine carbamoyltransferase